MKNISKISITEIYKLLMRNKIFSFSLILVIMLVLLLILMKSFAPKFNDNIIKYENIHLGRAIEKGLNNYNLTIDDAKKIKKIKIENVTGFYDLQDLRYFENLEEIDISDCSLKSLDGIETLDKLKKLKCNDNEIRDISALYSETLKSLNYLDISGNRISDITSILSEINSLEVFYANECKLIGNIDLGENVNIKELHLDDNYITGISAEIPNVELLSIQHNYINTINEFFKFNSVKELKLSGNPIDSLEGINCLNNLEGIYLEDTNINNVDELKYIENLNTLFIDKKIDRDEIRFIINNFKDGDIYTKKYVISNRYNIKTN